MVEVAEESAEAAWKIKNLTDFDRRLERAAQRVDGRSGEGGLAAMVVYEAALMKSGRPREEVREMVRSFREAFEDEEEPLTIAHASGIMRVEGDDWFFGDGALRVLAGRLLGQFQHRVAQYNYVDEGEVLRRWADGYDTRLFVRRRIFETEPVIGVVGGLDLPLLACGPDQEPVALLGVEPLDAALLPGRVGRRRGLLGLGLSVGRSYRPRLVGGFLLGLPAVGFEDDGILGYFHDDRVHAGPVLFPDRVLGDRRVEPEAPTVVLPVVEDALEEDLGLPGTALAAVDVVA